MGEALEPNALERWKISPLDFIQEILRDPKTGRPFNLFPDQVRWFRHCWAMREDGKLKYPEQVLSWIKKTGKSTTAAMQLLTTLLVYGGRHAEAYCAANDLEQARDRVFTEIKKIIEASPYLQREAVITLNEIKFPQLGSFVRAIGADAASAAGSHPVFISFDEVEGVTTERQRRFYDELIPITTTQQISCRLVTGHAGYAGQSLLLEEIYARGMALPEIEPHLHAGDHTLFTWRHECLAPWQTPEWLEQMRATTRPLQFIRQFQNQSVSAAAICITPEMFDRACKEPGPRPSDTKLLIDVGVDASTIRDNSAVFATTAEGDGVRIVEYKIFAPTPTDPLDFENTIERTLLDLNQRDRIRRVLIDNHQMVYLAQRLSKKMKIEALVQSPGNLSMIAQNLFDLFRGERLSTYPDAKLRSIITNTIFEEKGGVLRFARHQTTKIDATVALAMACYATTQAAGKHTYRWDVYDPLFVDDDAKPPEPAEPETPFSGNPCNGDWHKWRPPPRPPLPTAPKIEPPKERPTNEADRNLLQLYRGLDGAFRNGY